MCMVVIKIVGCCIHNLLQLSIIYEIKLWKSFATERECCFILWSTVITRQRIHLLGGGELMGH